jgi:hypothetical protein
MNVKWLLPLAVTLHNVEEAIWIPGFRTRHGWNSITASQFRLAALMVVLLAFAVTYVAIPNDRSRTASHLFYAFCWIMLLNVFWHVGVCFYFRAYAPGAITAVVLVLPITLYLIFRTRIRDSKKAPANGF